MRTWRTAVLAFSAWLSLVGCGGTDDGGAGDGGAAGSSCAEENALGSACAGAPASVCGGGVCTDGVACASVVEAADQGALAAAAGSAGAGTCIAVGPGAYGKVVLPGGVSLLGAGAASVTIEGVTVGSGTGAVLRGLAVGGGGIAIQDGAKDVAVDAVHVLGSQGDGVYAGEGAAVSVSRSTIEGSGKIGIFASGAAIAIQTTLVLSSGGPGLWLQCADGCACASAPSVTLEETAIRGSHLVGVALAGVHATITDVDITDTEPDAVSLSQGGGLAAASCAKVDAAGLHVERNRYYGILVDGASADLDGGVSARGIVVSKNDFMGVWVQGLAKDGSQPVTIASVKAEENSVVGFGFDGESYGIIVQGSEVRKTKLRSAPVVDGGEIGQQEVGDGLFWQAGVQATIDGLSLDGNARTSMLINGEVAAGSSVSGLGFLGGDEERGIIVQGLPEDGQVPDGLDAASGLAKVTIESAQIHAVALPPKAIAE